MAAQRSILSNIISMGTILLAGGHALAQDQATQLEKVVVQGNADPADTSDRIVQPTTRSATKTGSPVVETPQSVSTVTRRQIDEQRPQTVSQALRYTAGVLSDRDSDIRYDSVFLRGFGAFGTATRYASFLDGLKLPRGQAFAQTSIDPYLLDRIDVLKGPSALLYGQTSPGGLVNQVGRRPSSEPHHEVFIEGGMHGRVQGGFAASGPLTADGSWAYGLTAVTRSSGTRYEDVKERRLGVAPVIRWQPDSDTTLIVSGYFQEDPRGGYFNSLYPGFLAPAAYQPYLNRKLNIGDPNHDAFERKQYGMGYNFEHRVDDIVTVRSNFRFSHVDVDFKSLQMSGPIATSGLIPRHALRSLEDANGLSFDNQAEFNFDSGDLAHAVLAGIDYQHSTSNWEYRFGAAPSLDVVRPVYGQPLGPLAKIIDTRQQLEQTGVYLQDQLSWGAWRAVVGVRHDWASQDTDNHLRKSASRQTNEATSYRVGLLHLFDNGLAPYASYSTSFEPVVGIGADGTPFVPSTARQYEVGLKYEPTGFDALFTFSAFDIRQQHVLTPGRVPGFSVQQGEIRSRGVEFEARGSVTDNLELVAALTLLDTKVSASSNASSIGKRPQGVPEYFGSLWASYGVAAGVLNGLTVGAGNRMGGPQASHSPGRLAAMRIARMTAAGLATIFTEASVWLGLPPLGPGDCHTIAL